MKIRSVSGLLFIALFALVIASFTGFNVVMVGGVMLAASFINTPTGVFNLGNPQVWENDILKNLFKNNDFAKRAYNADQYVLATKVVHIPRAGKPSAVTKNLTQFPAAAVVRADDDVTYPIDSFYSTPRVIPQIDSYELSYDKRQSAVGEDTQNLIDTCMDGLLYNWGPLVLNTVLTTGPSGPATLPGATGSRLGVTSASLQKIKIQMDKAKIMAAGRVVLFTADHYNQFFNQLTEGEKTNFGRVANVATGIVGNYLGFDIMMRSTVLRYRGADAAITKVDEYDPAFATSDQSLDRAASLVYNDMCAERAFGAVEMFEQANHPGYYGDVFSFLLRMGGRIRRDAGVWAIVEAEG